MKSIKKIVLLLLLPLPALTIMAQKTKTKPAAEINIPMEPAYWQYDTANIEFIMHRDVKAVYFKKGTPLYLKNQQFSNGTIEYDVELTANSGFPGIYFRMTDDKKNGDNFYIRYFGTTSKESRTTLQYAAQIDGMSNWDLTDEYQAGASLVIPGWNHVKLVVSGKQMKAYVNDMGRPALMVPELEGGTTTGSIYFMGGQVTVANMVIKPDAVENLSAAPGYISTYNDPRYLRSWQVNQPIDFPQGKEILPANLPGHIKSDLPDSTTTWTTIMAENRGIVNLNRIFGSAKNFQRRFVWLKTSIESDKVQERTLNLGFSDDVWLFINGQLLYVDKNQYGSPGQKFPRGRCTIENAAIKLPLQQGKNEIMIGLANYFYGWGIIARLDDMDGIHVLSNGVK